MGLLDPARRKVAAALMEAYAGFPGAHRCAGGPPGRGAETIRLFDNATVRISSATMAPALRAAWKGLNYFGKMQGIPETTGRCSPGSDEIGGRNTTPIHQLLHGAWATDAPFQWTKPWPPTWGYAQSMVITWPRADQGQRRIAQPVQPRQRHCSDSWKPPASPRPASERYRPETHGRHQPALYLRRSRFARAPYYPVLRGLWQSRHLSRGLDGVRLHGDSWNVISRGDTPFDEDRWELYDRARFSQAHDPRIRSRKTATAASAVHGTGRRQPGSALAGSPSVDGPARSGGGLTRATYPQERCAGRCDTAYPTAPGHLLAEVEITGSNSSGVIAALVAAPAGWSLYLDRQQRPVFRYRVFDLKPSRSPARHRLSAGQHRGGI